MIDNGDGTQNSYFCPKYLTINMNNTIFQSEKIHDKVSVNNSKVYSAYQKSVVTTTTDPVIGKISVAKGQLISNWFFWVIGFLQKTNERIRLYYYDTSGWPVFVRFLEEIDDPKQPFRN